MNEVINRRKKVLEKLPEGSVLLLYSSKAKKQSGDNNYPYFVNRNFYYLTHIEQENTYLVLSKDLEILYIDEYSEYFEKWYGKKITSETASKISQIKDVRLTKDFLNEFKKISESYQNIYFDYDVDDFEIMFYRNHFNTTKSRDITPIMSELRMVKDESEIKDIVEAIKVTNIGLKKIIKNLSTAKKEYEIYNLFNHEILNNGTHEIGFPSIVASGVNACCLHYPTPFDNIVPNSLILCDVGSSYNHYSSDITRTFPVSGKYDEYQSLIYNIVLECNKKVIDYIRPGRTLAELQEFAKSFLAAKCLEHGIISKSEDIANYYYHGVSHHLGLDTHDLSDRNKPLVAGNVITVEPGLYIKEKKIGIRIEDDVLVTENGSECLSKFVEKEIKDIEKLF